METKVTTPAVKGIIISLIIIVYGIILHFAGQSQNRGLASVQMLILIAGLIWACTNYANQMNANVTFGNVFAHGFKTTAVVIVITAIYTILALKLIFPEMMDQALEQARKGMEEKNMPDDQMQTALDLTRRFFIPFTLGFIILGFGFVGAIGSLIGAAVAKKNPSNPFEQTNV